MDVAGTNLPAYEPVRALLARSAEKYGKGGAALTAYVGGEKVVDLWTGQARTGQPWQEETRAVVMSVSKGLTTVCAQILFDRGLLDLEAPVSAYWPEFAQAGKEKTLVRHVLGHTSGVLGFDGQADLLFADGTGWADNDAIIRRLAESSPSWEPGTRFGYHAFTYGWLTGELVRRISGKSVGQFFADEIAGPLKLDAQIGTPLGSQHHVAQVFNVTPGDTPKLLAPLMDAVQAHMRRSDTLSGRAFISGNGASMLDSIEELMSSPEFLAAEMPAGNATATARDLARVYAMLAGGGELDGVRIVSPESTRVFSGLSVHLPDALLSDLDLKAALKGNGGGPVTALVRTLGVPISKRLLGKKVRRGMGYMLNPGRNGLGAYFGPNPAAFGHDGAGGQVSFADVENVVSVGYVRNHLATKDTISPLLIDAVYKCANLPRKR